MGKYWNGYKWCDDPPMAGMMPKPIEQHEREALSEAELNPPEVTGEHEPMTEFDVSDITEHESWEMEATIGIKVDPLPVPEEPMPNLATIPLTLYPEKVVYAPLKEIPEEPVITDEVRERIRKELASKGDGGSK